MGAQYRSGCYMWSCVNDREWMGNYSECVSEMTADEVHLSFLVTGNVSTVNSRLAAITMDVSEFILIECCTIEYVYIDMN